MLNIHSVNKVVELIEKGIIESHSIDIEKLSDLTRLKITRRLNQMIRLCLFIELYRQSNATHFEPLLERKALHHAMHTLFGISPSEAKQYQLNEIVILFHNQIKEMQLSGSVNDLINELNDRVVLLTSTTKNSWRNTASEHRYMSEYHWNELPIEEAHRLLGELI
ncbi:ECs1072 family phage-associated protein [Providencia sp. PROV209]|uniref:ECs1072 family phage-associated protein n=1 Tax=Providencia sp. PROV209 TaxID=2949906 RepID=UPI00234A2D3D|nr:hypothetical protein [Providencia sp. PROV209]